MSKLKSPATISISGVTSAEFADMWTNFSIRNDGENTIYVSASDPECTPDGDGVYSIPAGGACVVDQAYGNDTLYFNGSGKAFVKGQSHGFNSFKSAPKGGDSGGDDEITELIPRINSISSSTGTCKFDINLFYADKDRKAYFPFNKISSDCLYCKSTAEKGAYVEFKFLVPQKVVKLILVTVQTEGCDTTRYPFAVDVFINDEWREVFSVEEVYGESWGHTLRFDYAIPVNLKNVKGLRWRTWGEAVPYKNIVIESLQMIGVKGESDLIPLIPKMLSDTEPSGLCYTGNNLNAEPAFHAFDDNDTTRCGYNAENSSNGFVVYEFDTPCKIDYVEVTVGVAGGKRDYDFTFSVFSQGEWHDIYTAENIPTSGTSSYQEDTLYGFVTNFEDEVSAIRWMSHATKTYGTGIGVVEIQVYKNKR